MVTGLFSLVYGFKHMKFEGQNYLNRAEQHALFVPVLMKNGLSFPVGEGLFPTPMYSTQLCIVYRWLYAVKRYFIGLHKNLSLLGLHSFSGVLKWEIRQTQEIV
jgi:hypothetical protein